MSRVEEIRARLEAATPGPWRFWTNGFDSHVIAAEDPKAGTFESIIGGEPHEGAVDGTDPNIALIAAAPSDLAYLLRIADQARLVLDEIENGDWDAMKSLGKKLRTALEGAPE